MGEVAAKDIAGSGSVQTLEVKTTQLGEWTALRPYYGQFWQHAGDMGEGPYQFRLTTEDGSVMTYTTSGSQLPTGDIDLGTNIQAGSNNSVPSPTQSPTPTPTPAPTTHFDSTSASTTSRAPTPTTASTTPAPTTRAPTTSLAPTPTPAPATSSSGAWGQCGGIQWSGPTQCIAGYRCVYSNDWYSQCLPSASAPTPSPSPTPPPAPPPPAPTNSPAPSPTP